MDICKKVLARDDRKMRPRIPSATVVEGLRPNNCKYFKKASFGECSICKPCYDNYRVFVKLVHEIHPDVKLNDDASLYVRGRICKNTIGKDRHRCEDNLCKDCSFVNYFVKDPSVIEKKANKIGATKTFTEEHGVEFCF